MQTLPEPRLSFISPIPVPATVVDRGVSYGLQPRQMQERHLSLTAAAIVHAALSNVELLTSVKAQVRQEKKKGQRQRQRGEEAA
jgi:hypothetical protein